MIMMMQVAAEEKGVFDLVISDVGLPDGTGHDLMRALKATYNLKVRPHTHTTNACVGHSMDTLFLQKGIALSGYGLEEDVRRTLEAGFDVHLTKPVHFSSLTEAIQTLLASSTPTPAPASASTTSSSTSDYSSCSSSSSSFTTATNAHTEPTSSCSTSSSSLSFSRDITSPAPSASTAFAPPHPPSLLTASLLQSATPDPTGGTEASSPSSPPPKGGENTTFF